MGRPTNLPHRRQLVAYKLLFWASVMRWLGRQDSNLRMPVPKTGALPLGDAPAGVPAGALKAAGERRL